MTTQTESLKGMILVIRAEGLGGENFSQEIFENLFVDSIPKAEGSIYDDGYYSELPRYEKLTLDLGQSDLLQYWFEDGLILTALEILSHPRGKQIPRMLLPIRSNIRSTFLERVPDDDIPKISRALCLSIFVNASDLNRQERRAYPLKLLLTDSPTLEEERRALLVSSVSLKLGIRPVWKIEALASFEAQLKFSRPSELQGFLLTDLCLDPETKTLIVHDLSLAVEPLRSLFQNEKSFFEHPLAGHEFLSPDFKARLNDLTPDQIEPLPVRLVHADPQIWVNQQGLIQYARVFSMESKNYTLWNISTQHRSLLEGLFFGLGSAIDHKNALLVQSRKGLKRDRDLRVLRHVGLFTYLIYEVATFLIRVPDLKTLSSSQTSDFFQQLLSKLGRLLFEIEKKAGLISLSQSQSIDYACSPKVIEALREYVHYLIKEAQSGSEYFFIDGFEVQVQGGLFAFLKLLRSIMVKAASQNRGECFTKARLSLFATDKDVLFDQAVTLDSSQAFFYSFSSSWLRAERVLGALLSVRSKGFEVFYEGLPLNEMSASDLKAEFTLIETASAASAAPAQTIDWFELNPQFFFKGIEIEPSQVQRLTKEGVLEFQGKIYLIQNKSLPSVQRLESFWSRIQSANTTRVSRRKGESYFKLPKSQVLELLALRSSGVAIQSTSERWKKICEFYDSLGGERESLQIPTSVEAVLKPYQNRGVQWFLDLYHLGLGGILADDMGLGKTLQTLVFLEILRLRKELGLALIVVPTSLTYNWMSEAKKFTPGLPIQNFQAKSKLKLQENLKQSPEGLVVCTYGLFTEHQDFFSQQKWNLLIFDEAQHLKNISAKRTTASRSVGASIKFCLTGTPLENHLGEFYSLIDLVVSGSLGDLASFRTRFVTSENLNQEELHYLKLKIKPLFLRRTKTEVLSELPPKIETSIRLPFEKRQEKIYRDIALSWNDKVKESILNQGESRSQLLMLTALLRLRQACSDPGAIPNVKYLEQPPKLTVLLEALEEVVEAGESALVFTQFLYTFDRIKKELSNRGKLSYFALHGGTPRSERERILKEFNESPNGVILLMTLKTGGVGLNLTKASYVFHLEPWWNPAVEDQATDRTYRIGQKKSVQVYRYLMRESVEEKIEILKARKSATFNALFSSSEVEDEINPTNNHLSQADFEFLLKP